VNLALQSLKEDGTLDARIAEWLPIPEDLPGIAEEIVNGHMRKGP